jgi:hypothetical protein
MKRKMLFSLAFCLTACTLPLASHAQSTLTPEARLQLDYLQALEKVEKQRAMQLNELNDNYHKKLLKLQDRLGDDPRAKAVAAEIERMEAPKPTIRDMDDDPELMNQFRAIYLRERKLVNLAIEDEREKLEQQNVEGQKDQGVPAPNTTSGQIMPRTHQPMPRTDQPMPRTSSGAAERSTVFITPPDADANQKIARTSTASGERYEREKVEVESFLPPAPAQLLEGETLIVRVHYERVAGSRARISIHPLSDQAPDTFISSSKTVFGLGDGIIELPIKARRAAQMDRLFLQVRDAVTDKLLTSSTVNASAVWVRR